MAGPKVSFIWKLYHRLCSSILPLPTFTADSSSFSQFTVVNSDPVMLTLEKVFLCAATPHIIKKKRCDIVCVGVDGWNRFCKLVRE